MPSDAIENLKKYVEDLEKATGKSLTSIDDYTVSIKEYSIPSYSENKVRPILTVEEDLVNADLASTQKEMFSLAQSRLDPEDRIAASEMCLHKFNSHRCTKQAGHMGNHAAHGILGGVLRKWSLEENPDSD